jgi:hypothetical protein
VDRAKHGGFPCSSALSARSLRVVDEVSMSIAEYSRKLNELDRLVNDPDVPIQPGRIWSLLADVSRHEAEGCVRIRTQKCGQGPVTCGMRR